MSFDELLKSSYAAKKEQVVVDADGVKLTFYANEISYLQRINLAGIQASGGDAYSQLVVYSITDQNGKRMTLDQAQSLNKDHAQLFFVAASKVNTQTEEEDKKKSD